MTVTTKGTNAQGQVVDNVQVWEQAIAPSRGSCHTNMGHHPAEGLGCDVGSQSDGQVCGTACQILARC